MVIQSNMSSKAVVDVWRNTAEIFKMYYIAISEQPLQEIVKSDFLPELLSKLNHAVGSSSNTCVEGG